MIQKVEAEAEIKAPTQIFGFNLVTDADDHQYLSFRWNEHTEIVFPIETLLYNFIFDFEAGPRAAATEMIKEDDRVLEVGSGIGTVTIVLAELAGHVVSYEPNPFYAMVCNTNLGLNNRKADIYNAALGIQAGRSPFYLREGGVTSSLWPDALYATRTLEEIEVQVVAIDAVVQDNEINALVIDAEGSEYELLTEMDLRPINKLIVEMHGQQLGDVATTEILVKLGEAGFDVAAVVGASLYPNASYVLAFGRPDVVESVRRGTAYVATEQLVRQRMGLGLGQGSE